ncbi:MAG: C-type lectin domain-containing protein, partial [Candidatus Nanohalobium sp.]
MNGEDCTEMYDGGSWNDIACGSSHPAVCEVNGHYERISSRTWSEAQSACVNRGGHIVTVNNAEENSFLDANYGNIWISYKDGREEGGDWHRGGYTNWKDISGDGEPNNAGGSEDCTEMYSSGVWNDLSCGDTRQGLCEIDGSYETTGYMSWSNARDECNSRGGHLATIESSSENQYIDSNYGNVWIGYHDHGNEASWRWVNRDPLKPVNPSPQDAQTVSSGTVTLSALFRDPEVLDGTLNFYTQQNGNIGSCSTSSNSRCSINFNAQECTTYNWYVESDDAGGLLKRSNTWT